MAIAVGLTAIRQTIQLKLCLFQLPTDGHSCLDYFHHATATLRQPPAPPAPPTAPAGVWLMANSSESTTPSTSSVFAQLIVNETVDYGGLARATMDQQHCMDVQEAILASNINDVTRLTTVKAVIGFVYSTLFILGILGNGGVVTAVARNKRLQSARNIFLLNLMITDLLLCLTAIPVTPWYGLSKTWQFGSLMCRLVPLSNSCSVFVTSWSLTVISLDKFIHILDSTKEAIRLREAGLITAAIWIICSVINIPYLLSYELVDGSYYVATNTTPFCGQFCDELNWETDNHRRGYGTTVMLLQFVVPMAIITYCYSRILAKVRRDMIVHNAQFSASLSSSQRLEAMQRKRRVNYILIGMVATFIAAWFPLTLVNILKDFKTEPSFMKAQPYLWPLVAHAIAMSTVVVNPVLFFWLTRKQKAPRVARMLANNTADMFNSFASRISRSNTFRRASTIRSTLSQHRGSEARKIKSCQVSRVSSERTSTVSRSERLTVTGAPRDIEPSNGFVATECAPLLNRQLSPTPGSRVENAGKRPLGVITRLGSTKSLLLTTSSSREPTPAADATIETELNLVGTLPLDDRKSTSSNGAKML